MIIRHSNHAYHVKQYAFFLFDHNRYKEAQKYFESLLNKQQNEHMDISSIYYGYARTLENLDCASVAEKYYKMAIECRNEPQSRRWNKGLMNHMYGKFLYDQGRYKEAKHQFQIAMKNNEGFATNHYRLSLVLLKLGDLKGYEHHLKITLQIDPYFKDAVVELERYYASLSEMEMETKMNSSSIGSSVVSFYNTEFDGFWFDVVGIRNEIFNGYYDRFCKNNKNDIRYILFNDNIEKELESDIGVYASEDLEIIMTEIKYLRKHRV